MKFTRFIGRANRNVAYRAALRDRAVRKIDLRPVGGNVTIEFKLDGEQPISLPMTPVVRDLVDLAAMVYTADELCRRQEAPDRWNRRFQGVIPVRDPRLWQDATPALQGLLRFLSGDEFSFEWVRTKTVPALRNHRATIPEGFDTVCLFSGGADSLVGAHQLLAAGRRVILVGHQADGITASTQKDVLTFFRRRFGEQVAFVQVRAARSPRAQPTFPLGKKVEITHRPRSFLFLALATAVAAAAHVDEIVIAENGLIALNPPLNVSRLGTLSTRTAHPRFLVAFQEWVHAIGAFEGRIRNPFMYLSKTDVVRQARGPLRRVLPRTLSCSHLGRNRWAKFRGHHCGYCIPCIYRRVAFDSLGLDDPADYYRNVFERFGTLSTNERSDVRALAGFALRVAAMSPIERMAAAIAHGAVEARALESLGPAVPDPYVAWSDMLHRWSTEFLATACKWASRDMRRRLRI